ncbi:MAG: hypothetical protein K2L87_05785, partial [Clostridiales bacterium]|nr:hypothetical protein [Clostridiales bacterium]
LEGDYEFSFTVRPEQVKVGDSLGKFQVEGGYISSVKRLKEGVIVRIANRTEQKKTVTCSGACAQEIDNYERLCGAPMKAPFTLELAPYEMKSLFIKEL